ncbi:MULTISPECIES: adenosine deaminase [Pseudoalteromonas]|uniref:Adenosine deaminase n=1 Tax=Pseudoalteromonas piscicida TaxID=43662 RepID=A0AAD0W348_PSEO7|nr:MULTISPECIES: adenosine deaminase [Pseudoalteromonas]ASD65669.1 adenosine deaminase [Pseudoalteromonas piscicida]AUJ68445.1 Aminodeoxyfutalosine deaminase [Pseudoalteromonas sp. NC201]AXQ96424.1 adenosine deaminase [Pseudoalteromonas piscicida]AXR00708.1 adenosine deaminase [Pseudoalteromonas piscicida]KID39715.1 adenosine deaminase [Pseudoalteromonas flavipulchra NCIMB 2033 = ATCC BAA-314]
MINNTLPLLDLHRHLDGNVRATTILELGQQFNMDLPATDLEGLRPHVQVLDNAPNLMAFLEKLDWGVKVLGDYDACRRIAIENVADAVAQGIDYTELRFSPYYMAKTHNLHPQGVVEAVVDGVQSAVKGQDIKVNLIGIMSRTFGVEKCQYELDALLAFKEQLVAIDLAGDELGFPGELFIEHYKQVRDAYLGVTVHAGEAEGAVSIWQAIKELGATRIGHGVKAIHDPALMDYLRDNRIGIESCLTSNIQTSTVESLTTHPLKAFLDHGVLATINTDDPAVQGIELDNEYSHAAAAAGLDLSDIHKAQRNAVEIAFLSEADKKALLAKKA